MPNFPMVCFYLFLLLFYSNYFITSCSIQSPKRTQLSAIWAMFLAQNLNKDKKHLTLPIHTYLDMLATYLLSNHKTFMPRLTEKSQKTAIKVITTKVFSFPMMSNIPQQPRIPILIQMS